MTGPVREGTILDDRFELRDRIDSGGLATVWRGIDRATGDPVAVKCERDEVHDRDQVRAHFRQELRWFRRFEGGPVPGSLVHFVDGSADEDRCYVVTELIDGGAVDDYFDVRASPGVDAFRAIGGPVCRALAFLHRNGVLHLDLKPTNVLVRRRGLPAVIDLNSAVSRERGTETLFHHDPFKPPELTPTDLRDEPAGPWSDVYALGKVLAFLLTGTSVPFTDSSVSNWHAIDPRSHGGDCPAELASVVQRATEPRPRDRFDDADALYASLVPYFDHPESSALLTHASGRGVRVWPGDTLGRWTADRWTPAVVLPDEERFLSPNHAVLEVDGSDWYLRDRSLNGTYVRKGDDWQYVLSRDGVEHRQRAETLPSNADPPRAIRLADGDRIAPVNPRYGEILSFRLP